MSSLVEVADQLDINSSDRDVSITLGSDPVIIIADYEVEVIEVPEQGPPGPMGPVSTTPGPPGPQGPQGYPGLDGTLIRYGTSNPTPEIGNNGDSYINKTTNFLFGPKAGGSWPAGVSLVGPQGIQGVKGDKGDQGIQGVQGVQGVPGNDGNTVLYGTSDPLPAVGVNGNFYINQITHVMFGPKAGGAWPAGASLIGPQGPIGPPGGATVYIGDAPPAGAPDSSLWWKSSNGQFYIKYNDGNSSQWVIAVPAPDVAAFVQKVGDTMAGPLLLAGDPTAALGAATKQYVDGSASGDFPPFYISVVPASNALTIAVKTLAGADPSPASPVYMKFRSATGIPVNRAVTAPLSITIPAGASIGTVNGVPFRLWVAAFDDGGTVRLGVRLCANQANYYSVLNPPEHAALVFTAPPGNGVHTFYTVGSTSAARFWKWIGYLNFEGGQATAGQWVTGPSFVEIVNPSTPRPGARLQSIFNQAVGGASLNVTTPVELGSPATPITMASAANFVRMECDGYIYLRSGVAHQQGLITFRRDSVNVSFSNSNYYTAATTDSIANIHQTIWDAPRTTAQVMYKIMAQNVSSGSGLIQYNIWNHIVEEVMT